MIPFLFKETGIYSQGAECQKNQSCPEKLKFSEMFLYDPNILKLFTVLAILNLLECPIQ